MNPTILGPDEGETIVVRGNRVVVKAAGPRVSVVDFTSPAGFPGPPPHVHPAFDEVFVGLEGTLALHVRDDVHELVPGGTAFVPGNVPHTFTVTSDGPARFLVVCAPGGFEDYFRALALDDDAAVAEVRTRVGYLSVTAASSTA